MNMKESVRVLNKVVSNAFSLMHNELATYIREYEDGEMFVDYGYDVAPMYAYIIDGCQTIEKHIKAIKVEGDDILIFVDGFNFTYKDMSEVDWEKRNKVYCLNNPLKYSDGLEHSLTNLSILNSIDEYMDNNSEEK